MRFRIALVAAIAAAVAFVRPADAQTLSSYSLIDSGQVGYRITLYKSSTTPTNSTPASVSADANGNPMSGTVGLTNPNGTALFVQGVTNGLPLSINFAAPQHVICDSGCGGGGGGGGAVFGPTAVGTANANPPVMVGGTIDGTATGAVSILKVVSGAAFINCANCSGSGISVAFGGAIGSVGTPGGFKDGSGNFQPLLGDVTNGQWVNVKASVSIPVTGTFFQATQPISAVSLPLPAGAATQTTLASILSALGSPFQAGGSIGNTSFGISGTLPAYAATPTFNLGTLNGAATAANQTSVIGTAGAGTAATNSLLVGGIFNSTPITVANAQQASLQVDANGYLKVNVAVGGGTGGTSSTFSATFPTTGTAIGMSQGGNMVALTGTSGNLNVQCSNCSGSGASAADAATFTAGTSVFAPAGGEFTSGGATACVTGHQCLVGITAARAFLTDLSSLAGTALGAGSNYGTSPGAVNVMGVNAFVTNPVTVAQATAASLNATVVGTGTFAVQAAQSGTWNITNISGTVPLPTGAATSANQQTNAAAGSTTSGQTGIMNLAAVTTAAPAYTTAQSNFMSLTTAGGQRTDMSSIAGTTTLTGAGAVGAGAQRVAIGQDTTTIAGSAPGTAGSASANVLSIQGIASMTPVLVNPGTASNFGVQTQGSTTSGQSGALMQAAVLASSPTYTTAQTSPLTQTTSGALNVNIASGNISGFATSANQTSQITQETATAAALGTTADAPCTLPATTTACTQIALAKAAANSINSSVPAGTAIIGKVGIDQTTPGTTNGVQLPSSQVAVGATGSAPPSNAGSMGASASGATGGLLQGVKQCDQMAIYDASTAGSTLLVTGVASRKIYVCGYILGVGGTATNLKLVEGTTTTTACDTGTVSDTPAWQLAANAQFGMNGPFFNGFSTQTAGKNLCINASGANAAQAQVFYSIQ